MKIYTRDGDDGSTGLYFGGRVSKNAPQIDLNGAVDEAQACLGVARAWCDKGSRLNDLLVSVERDLWILMAEVATAAENRHKLKDGATRVTAAMVDRLENEIDALSATMPALKEFVVPGESLVRGAGRRANGNPSRRARGRRVRTRRVIGGHVPQSTE